VTTAAVQDPIITISIVAGILAVAGIAFYFAFLAGKKRTAALADVALLMGFTFEAKVPKERLATLGSFHLFKRGRSQRAKNLMRGKSGYGEVVVLDYQYTTGSGKSSHTHNQTVAIFPGVATAAGLPEFTLAPEHWWDKIGQVLGYQDIDFEASEEFSKHYLLRGPSETAIRAAFGTEALGFFAQNQGWSVESAGGALAVYRGEKRCTPEEFQPFLAETAAVRRALVRDSSGRPAPILTPRPA
jgi:hypothetical protein